MNNTLLPLISDRFGRKHLFDLLCWQSWHDTAWHDAMKRNEIHVCIAFPNHPTVLNSDFGSILIGTLGRPSVHCKLIFTSLTNVIQQDIFTIDRLYSYCTYIRCWSSNNFKLILSLNCRTLSLLPPPLSHSFSHSHRLTHL